MAKLDFYPLDALYKIEEGKAIVYLYGNSEQGRVLVKSSNFLPYFFVVPKKGKEDQLLDKLTKFSFTENEREISVFKAEFDERKIGFENTKIIKCSTIIPKDIPLLAKEIKEFDNVSQVNEADIRFVKRFLIDNNISMFEKCTAIGEFIKSSNKAQVFIAQSITPTDGKYSNPNILAIDIETEDITNSPILMISFFGRDCQKVLTWKKQNFKEKYVEICENEGAMLIRFGEILKEQDPDIICGYFSDEFDLPFIKQRAQLLKIELKLGLNNSSIELSKGKKKASYIEGIIHLDVFKFIKYVWGQGLATNWFDLNSVANEILGEGKVEVNITSLKDTWDNNESLDKFAEYNLKDSELTYKLAQKIIIDVLEFCKLTHLTANEVSRTRFSALVEGFLITKAYDDKVLVPRIPGHREIIERRRKSYQGAFVFQPQPGLYTNIAVYDFKSLYPTIISAHNISPETIDCECCPTNTAPGLNHWFCSKRGFIPEAEEELVKRRIVLKGIIQKEGSSKVLSARSHALKTLANAMYGYIGFFASRWYSFEAAEAITAYGREYLNKVIKDAKEAGFDVIYGDTDSIFLMLPNKNLKKANKFAEKVNEKLPGLMELEFDGFYPRGIFVSVKSSDTGAKKKYALINEKGVITIKGFETVRRNISKMAREAQAKVLELVLEGDANKALKFVNELVEQVKTNSIPKEKMIIKTQIKKAISDYEAMSPHVAVALKLIKMGEKINIGDTIEYVVLNGSGRVGDRAEPAKFVDNPDYDTEYYVSKQLIPAVESIFLVLGIRKEKLLKNNQSNLSSFFK